MFSAKKYLVTAGPTVEAIDPVRFISNHSTGKMGYAVAKELAERGAEVVLVSGPTALDIPVVEGGGGGRVAGRGGVVGGHESVGRHGVVGGDRSGGGHRSMGGSIRRVDVTSAEDMWLAVRDLWPQMDGAVMCAAVADYTPVEVSEVKIKKQGPLIAAANLRSDAVEIMPASGKELLGAPCPPLGGADDLQCKSGNITLELRPTKDIAAELGRTKRADQILVGFALETHDEEANALTKMLRKGLDMIVLNSLRDAGAGFGGDTNKVTIFSRRTGAGGCVDHSVGSGVGADPVSCSDHSAGASGCSDLSTGVGGTLSVGVGETSEAAGDYVSEAMSGIGEVTKTVYPLESKHSAAAHIVDAIAALK